MPGNLSLVPNERVGGAWNAPVLNHRASVRSLELRMGSLTRFGRNCRLKVREVFADCVIHTCCPVCNVTIPDVCQLPTTQASGPEFSIALPFPNGRSYTNALTKRCGKCDWLSPCSSARL